MAVKTAQGRTKAPDNAGTDDKEILSSEQASNMLVGTLTNEPVILEIGLTKSEVTRRLTKPFPQEAIKERIGGGNTRLKYVDSNTVISRLIEATNNTFTLEVTNTDHIGDVMLAYVRLTIPGFGFGREHVGVQVIRNRNGQQVSEDMLKGAISDGVKKAAWLYGVARELYGPDYEELASRPVEPTDSEKLAQLLKQRGITKLSQVNTEAQNKFEKPFADLTGEEVTQWLKDEERKEQVPF